MCFLEFVNIGAGMNHEYLIYKQKKTKVCPGLFLFYYVCDYSMSASSPNHFLYILAYWPDSFSFKIT